MPIPKPTNKGKPSIVETDNGRWALLDSDGCIIRDDLATPSLGFVRLVRPRRVRNARSISPHADRLLNEEAIVMIPRHEAIMGLDVITALVCKCGGVIQQVCPHSKVSHQLVWKCSWCKKRKGKLTDDEIEALTAFIDKYGWNQQPLRRNEATGGYDSLRKSVRTRSIRVAEPHASADG